MRQQPKQDRSWESRGMPVSVVTTCIFLCCGMMGVGAEKESYIEVQPNMLQRQAMDRTGALIQAAYPQVDKRWLAAFLTDRFLSQPVLALPLMDFHFPAGNQPVEIWGTSANAALGVKFDRLPPGISMPESTERDTKVLQNNAQVVAERLVPEVQGREGLTLSASATHGTIEGRFLIDGAFGYIWRIKRKFSSAEIEVQVGARDGQIKRIMVTPAPEDYLGEPKVTREEALKMVEALPRVGKWFNPNLLSLGCQGSGVQRRLVWSYYPPPGSDGALPKRYAVWDAMNGEILLSDCMNGGTKEKPYHNPGFYAGPGKDQLEASIKKWAAEIEARNSPKDRHPLFLMTVTNVVPQSVVSPTNTASPPR